MVVADMSDTGGDQVARVLPHLAVGKPSQLDESVSLLGMMFAVTSEVRKRPHYSLLPTHGLLIVLLCSMPQLIPQEKGHRPPPPSPSLIRDSRSCVWHKLHPSDNARVTSWYDLGGQSPCSIGRSFTQLAQL